MSLARAFTRRLGRGGERAQADNAKTRPQISLPMELTETTNMLSFDAPDISSFQFLHNVQTPSKSGQESGVSTPCSEPSSSGRSSDDHSSHDNNSFTPATENAPTLTDASSAESSPIAQKDFRNEYFPTSARASSGSTLATDDVPPSVPRRCPSHSKREHERVARSRSVSRASGHGYSRASGPAETAEMTSRDTASPKPESDWRTSFDILGRSGSLMDRSPREHSSEHSSGTSTPSRSLSASRAERRPNHPFSQELEQLNEVAEDVTGLDNALESYQDEDIMLKRGLVKHSVDVYAADILNLKGICFADGETRIAYVDATGMQGWI